VLTSGGPTTGGTTVRVEWELFTVLAGPKGSQIHSRIRFANPPRIESSYR